jgi:hypothetical protein
MPLKISLINIKEEFEKLKGNRAKLTKEESKKAVKNMIGDLRAKTPVDTGLARDSWKSEESLTGIDIKNTTEYIQYLNQGSSTQAPAYFIESVALRYGDPVGKIVDVE